MPDLVALCVPGGPDFVAVLQRTWEAGDAVLPLDPRLPDPAIEELLTTLRPAAIIDAVGDRHRLDGAVGVEPGDALVMATSGSTGRPKGVVHTHASVAASAAATNAALGVDPDRDRFVCCMPLNHVAGLSVVTRALAAGTPCEVLPAFDAATVEEAARQRGGTITTMVPTALARIDTRLYRRIVVGGAAPPDQLPSNVTVSYGLTETGSAVTYDGALLAGVEIRVIDREIQVRGPMLLRCYRDGTDPRVPDGWFATGDEGELTPDGRLVVHGRGDDLIITGGENVWPTPVEQILRRLPGIAEVAVVGRPDPEWGQQVTAVVVPTDPATPPTLEELRTAVKAHLPAFAAPRRLEVVDNLPTTLLGKVRRRQV